MSENINIVSNVDQLNNMIESFYYYFCRILDKNSQNYDNNNNTNTIIDLRHFRQAIIVYECVVVCGCVCVCDC